MRLIVSEIEETGQLSTHTELVLARLDEVLAPRSSYHDPRGLRQLYDLVEVYVCGFKALGVPSESNYGSLLYLF